MNLAQDKRKRRTSLLRILGTIISLGLVAFLIWQNWNDFINSFSRLSLGLLFSLLFLAFLSRFIVTTRWFVILKVIEPNLRFSQAFKLSFVGLFTTNFLPSTIGGDLVKLGGAVQYGFDAASVAGSLVVDRLVGMTTMATFLPVGLLAIPKGNNLSVLLSSASPGGWIGILWEKIKSYTKRVIIALKIWVKHPVQLIFAAGLSFLHMGCTFTMVFLIFRGLNDPISWWFSGGLWVLVYFVTLLPISINGLGLQEASLSLVYTSFAGVSESNSLVLAIMIRVLFMIASLPGAFFLSQTISGDNIMAKIRQ